METYKTENVMSCDTPHTNEQDLNTQFSDGENNGNQKEKEKRSNIFRTIIACELVVVIIALFVIAGSLGGEKHLSGTWEADGEDRIVFYSGYYDYYVEKIYFFKDNTFKIEAKNYQNVEYVHWGEYKLMNNGEAIKLSYFGVEYTCGIEKNGDTMTFIKESGKEYKYVKD